jgi:cysteine desulfurase
MTCKNHIIYLDHNATTRIAPEVLRAMMPYLGDNFGNPSSSHLLGARARKGVDLARKQIASLLGCKEHEIIFTSGGTESNNMVLKGLINLDDPRKAHIITCAVEHSSIMNPILYLMELGVRVSILPVDSFGIVDPADVQKAISADTSLISIMLANNETGSIQPIREISEIAKEYDIPVHTDAAQAVGKLEVNVNELGIDFLSVAGHKIYGPKGIGVLYIREGMKMTPLLHGAGQEGGRRAGTESVILAVGLGEACRVAKKRLKNDIESMLLLRNHLQEILFEGLAGVVLNGHPVKRLPNTLNISVPGLRGDQILEGLPIAASTGAACHDQEVGVSYVLSAMGVAPEIGMGTLRFSVGRENNMDMIVKAGKLIIDRIKRMRKGEC